MPRIVLERLNAGTRCGNYPLMATTRSLLLLALSLLGCASESGGKGGREPELPKGGCTLKAVVHGVAFDIDPAVGPSIASAKARLCWDGTCHDPSFVHLMESTGPVRTLRSADGKMESAAFGPPTGGKHGFWELADLPSGPVEIRVELAGGDGSVVVRDSVVVHPTMREANGPGCGEDGPQAAVVVTAEGKLRER